MKMVSLTNTKGKARTFILLESRENLTKMKTQLELIISENMKSISNQQCKRNVLNQSGVKNKIYINFVEKLT